MSANNDRSVSKILLTGAVALFALGIGQAQAATFDITFTGTVANGIPINFDSGGLHYDTWQVQMDPFGPFTVSQGDTINATINFDSTVTTPASVQRTTFTFGLDGPNFPAGDVGTSGSTAFFLSNVAGLSGPGGTGSAGWIPNSIGFFPPDNGVITFDSVTSNFTVDTLSGSATLDNARFVSYVVTPEPASMGILLIGTALVGLRRPKDRSQA